MNKLFQTYLYPSLAKREIETKTDSESGILYAVKTFLLNIFMFLGIP